MLYGGIIGGRGKGRCPGSSDDFILFFSDSRCFFLVLEYAGETWSVSGIFATAPL